MALCLAVCEDRREPGWLCAVHFGKPWQLISACLADTVSSNVGSRGGDATYRGSMVQLTVRA
jgi:hypothetical protein